MRITFLRHGHAEHNEAHETHGDIVYTWNIFHDALLTEKGLDQASHVVLSHSPDRVYSSPLRRCIQTARGACPDGFIHVHDGLIERQCDHPCNRKSNISTILQVSYNLDISHVSDSLPYIDNESDCELRNRARKTIYEILCESADASHVLIVTHWDFLRMLLGKELENCEMYVLENVGPHDFHSCDLESVSPSFFSPH
jgi:broad specificity phosphatase PhoE